MSDSGKQIGDCKHGKPADYCVECLRDEKGKEMTALDAFCKALDGEWIVERHEIMVRVHYRSKNYPSITFSHVPCEESEAIPVGTTGRIGFIAEEERTVTP